MRRANRRDVLAYLKFIDAAGWSPNASTKNQRSEEPLMTIKDRLRTLINRVDDLINEAESLAIKTDDRTTDDLREVVTTLVGVRTDLERIAGRQAAR